MDYFAPFAEDRSNFYYFDVDVDVVGFNAKSCLRCPCDKNLISWGFCVLRCKRADSLDVVREFDEISRREGVSAEVEPT